MKKKMKFITFGLVILVVGVLFIGYKHFVSAESSTTSYPVVNRIKTRIYGRMDQAFVNRGIWTILLPNESIDSINQQASDLGIPSGQLRLIKLIQTVDTSFTVDEGKDMSIQDLLTLVKDNEAIQVRVQQLQDRQNEINQLLPTLDPTKDQTQIASLQQELNDIDTQLYKLKVMKQRLVEAKDRLTIRIRQHRENCLNS